VKKFVLFLSLFILAACVSDGDDDDFYDPPPSDYNGWAIQFSPSMPEKISDSFNFPRCSDPVSPSGPSVHYVTKSTGPMATRDMALTYRIEGDGVFKATEGHSPRLSLYFQRIGDDLSAEGKLAAYRWFSKDKVAMAAGRHTIKVPLVHAEWGPVYSGSEFNTDAYFKAAMREAARVGFVLGGSVGAGHGVCLASGTAKFIIEGFSH
jgi:hypothetical protein